MADTKFTITIPEAQATRIITAICLAADEEVSAPNAKKVVVRMIRQYVEDYERRHTTIQGAELT